MHNIEFDFQLTHWSPVHVNQQEGYCSIKYTNYLNRLPPGAHELAYSQIKRVIETDNNFTFAHNHYFLWPQGNIRNKLNTLEYLINNIVEQTLLYLCSIDSVATQIRAAYEVSHSSNINLTQAHLQTNHTIDTYLSRQTNGNTDNTQRLPTTESTTDANTSSNNDTLTDCTSNINTIENNK